MDLRLYDHFGCQYARYNFLFVGQSSSRRLEKFGEDIPTNPEIIGGHMQNFKSIFFGDSVPDGGEVR